MLSLVNNLSALNAENNLSNSNMALNTALQRLSSGLRINSGADDPAGLVISQIQQAQMSGLQTAISNTSTDVNVAQTADGGLNQINALLVQIRGLAVGAANTGANDSNMLAADQAQITNALQTITRIATSTQYGKEQLLDGSHAVTASVQQTPVATVQTGASGGTETGTLSASATSSAAAGNYTATITSLAAQATATSSSFAAGLAVAAGDKETLTINGASSVQIQLNGGTTGLSASDVENAINQYSSQTGVTASIPTSGGNAGKIVLTANAYGAVGNGFSVTESGKNDLGFSASAGTAKSFAGGADVVGTLTGPSGAVNATGSGNVLTGGGLSITTDPTGAVGTIKVAVAAGNTGNTAAATVNTASGTYTADITQLATQATLLGSTDLTNQKVVGANEADLLTINGVQIQLNGGAAGLDANGAATAINQYTNQTGVTASVDTTGGQFLKLTSVGYGSTQQIKVEESGVSNPSNPSATLVGLGTGGLASATLTAGKDVAGTITTTDSTGKTITVAATGAGNVLTGANGLTINTNPNGATGNLTTVVTNNSLEFQIGANAGQSANLAIGNVQADALGLSVTNNSGIVNLSMVDVSNSNQSFSDILNVVDKAINDVSTLAGALGSFQNNTLQATAQNLQTSLQNTTAANSTIRDTNFAQESAIYAQNQVLVQAGTQVLKNANQLPQLALALLQ